MGGWETCLVASLRESASGAGGSLRFGRKGICQWPGPGAEGSLGRAREGAFRRFGQEGAWGGRDSRAREPASGAGRSLGRTREGPARGGRRAAGSESDRLPYGGPWPRLERGGPARASLPIQNFQYCFLKQVGRRLLSCIHGQHSQRASKLTVVRTSKA